MGTRNVVDSEDSREKYQRWVWSINPQCRGCQAQELASVIPIASENDATCKFHVPIGPGDKCLFMKPKEATAK